MTPVPHPVRKSGKVLLHSSGATDRSASRTHIRCQRRVHERHRDRLDHATRWSRSSAENSSPRARPPDYDESSARRDHQASAAVIAPSASRMPSPTSPAVAAQCRGTRSHSPRGANGARRKSAVPEPCLHRRRAVVAARAIRRPVRRGAGWPRMSYSRSLTLAKSRSKCVAHEPSDSSPRVAQFVVPMNLECRAVRPPSGVGRARQVSWRIRGTTCSLRGPSLRRVKPTE